MFALRREKSCDLSESMQGNRWMKAAWWPAVMECCRPSAGNVNTAHSPGKKKQKNKNTAARRQCITAGMVCQRPRGLSSPVDDNLCGGGNLPVRRQPSAPGKSARSSGVNIHLRDRPEADLQEASSTALGRHKHETKHHPSRMVAAPSGPALYMYIFISLGGQVKAD